MGLQPTAIVLVASFLVLLFMWLQFKAGRALGEAQPNRAVIGSFSGALFGTWLMVWLLFARHGFLDRWDLRPPSMVFASVATLALALFVALGPIGRRLSRGLSLGALTLVMFACVAALSLVVGVSQLHRFAPGPAWVWVPTGVMPFALTFLLITARKVWDATHAPRLRPMTHA